MMGIMNRITKRYVLSAKEGPFTGDDDSDMVDVAKLNNDPTGVHPNDVPRDNGRMMRNLMVEAIREFMTPDRRTFMSTDLLSDEVAIFREVVERASEGNYDLTEADVDCFRSLAKQVIERTVVNVSGTYGPSIWCWPATSTAFKVKHLVARDQAIIEVLDSYEIKPMIDGVIQK